MKPNTGPQAPSLRDGVYPSATFGRTTHAGSFRTVSAFLKPLHA